MYLFHNNTSVYSEESLEPPPTPKLENHPLSAVCDCLFNILAATPAGFSSGNFIEGSGYPMMGTLSYYDEQVLSL
jgi:hypothetical protein